jgi:hypothetical protein
VEAIGCGCKVCKQGLGDTVNEMIQNQIEPVAVLKFLNSKGCKVSEKLLRKHLSAFSIPFPENETQFDNTLETIPNNLVEIDFSEYKIDLSNPEIALELLQKINLQIFLNQSRITLQAQNNVLNGVCPDIPKEILRNQALALDMLDKCTGLSVITNQQQAIKTVESMGLTITPVTPAIKNVQN